MSVQYKINSKLDKVRLATPQHKAYLTKRVLLRSISRRSHELYESAMSLQGYIMTVENGAVVKLMADGRREHISNIKAIKRPHKIVLD